MNSTDLIERLKVDVENWEFLPAHVVQNMRDAITALSPVLSDEVEKIIERLTTHEPMHLGMSSYEVRHKAADLLEKLSRKNEELDYLTNLQDKASDTLHAKCVEQRERIEELERWNAEMVAKAASGGTLAAYREQSEQFCAIKFQRDQLAEAIETLGTKGFLSFEDRAAFARAEHKRIMGEK